MLNVVMHAAPSDLGQMEGPFSNTGVSTLCWAVSLFAHKMISGVGSKVATALKRKSVSKF